MSFLVLILLLTTLLSFGLSYFAWHQYKKSSVHIFYALTNVSIGGWSLGWFMYFFLVESRPDQALVASRLAEFFGILIAILWLHFTLAFLRKIQVHKKILLIGYSLAIPIAIVTLLTNFTFPHLSVIAPFGIYPIAGPGWYIHSFVFYLLIFYSIYKLIKAYKETFGHKRVQVKYLLIISLVGFVLGATTHILPFNILIFPIGFYFIWIYLSITAYAILKHRLMDITVILRKSVIFSLLVILVTVFYSMAVFVSQRFFQVKFGLNQWTVAFLASLIVALGFSPIKNLLAKITDKIFFKDRYDYQETIQQVSQAISSMIKLDELLFLLKKTLRETVKVKSSALFLFNKIENRYEEQLLTKGQPQIIEQKSSLALYLLYTRQLVVTEELEQQILDQQGTIKNLGQLAQVKEKLNQNGWAVAIPLILKNKVVGILNLGPKLSQDAFSDTDLQLLTTLANQTAMAVENASVYEKEKKLSQAKSEFVSVASHRLRTPLSVVKWALNLLDEDKANLSQRQRELVEKALASNDTMIKLANDLLDVSRIEERKITSHLSFIHLEKIVEEIIVEFKPVIEKKELIVNFIKSKEPLPKIKVDVDRIKIALKNIIYNAIIYTAKNGQIFVSLKLEKDKQSILLTVKDTGIGIPIQHQDQIFTKFYREDKAISAYTEGSGLGLFTAKKVIEEHQGEIWFESAPGQGTTFWIRLKTKNENNNNNKKQNI